MKKQFTIAAALMMTTTAASASGIDRNLTNYGILFETGNYVELSYATVSPSVSGTYGPTATLLGSGVTDTGVMSEDFNTLSGSVKYDLTDKLALGLFSNQPFGANSNYPGGFYQGLAAEWNSRGTSVVLKYKVTPNISVYGGARSIVSQADILIPNQMAGAEVAGQLIADATAAGEGAAAAAAAAAAAVVAAQAATNPAEAQTLAAQAAAFGERALTLQAQAEAAAAQAQAILNPTNATLGPFTYTANTETDRQTSYIVGAAYERPEIALRAALTYESGYTHTFNTTENLAAAGLSDLQSVTKITMPDVYTLDFQSGVAKDTLVFGSIRHATWADWEVRPNGYETVTGGDRVTGIDSDTTTYRIGVGRKFNDAFSGFTRITYEAANGDVASQLAPTDGSTAYGFGGTYNNGPIKLTGGIEYITFGEATDDSDTVFAENDAVAVGVSVGYRF
jgi:long-chain fatty acid transport protein